MTTLSPAFLGRSEDQSRLQQLLDRSVDSQLGAFLRKQLELIEVVRKSRYLCENYKMD